LDDNIDLGLGLGSGDGDRVFRERRWGQRIEKVREDLIGVVE